MIRKTTEITATEPTHDENGAWVLSRFIYNQTMVIMDCRDRRPAVIRYRQELFNEFQTWLSGVPPVESFRTVPRIEEQAMFDADVFQIRLLALGTFDHCDDEAKVRAMLRLLDFPVLTSELIDEGRLEDNRRVIPYREVYRPAISPPRDDSVEHWRAEARRLQREGASNSQIIYCLHRAHEIEQRERALAFDPTTPRYFDEMEGGPLVPRQSRSRRRRLLD